MTERKGVSPAEILAIALACEAETCPYLEGRKAEFENYLFLDCGDAAFCHAIETGFRHFGRYYFRPACGGGQGQGCGACVPVRVRVADFSPSRSQRRVLRKGAAVALQIDRPACTDEKYLLYRRHKQRFPQLAREGEAESGELTREGFEQAFYEGGPFTWECTYRLEGRLVGAGLIDIASRALSSIYFFFADEYEALSPGTLSILAELGLARRLEIPYYYLGYAVHGNTAMRYKADFRPCEYFDGQGWHPLREDKAFLIDPARLRTAQFKPLLGEDDRGNAQG